LNYRHAFHAGNFADLVKHATLTVLLDEMSRDSSALTVVDTHAGAGAYDLQGEMALRSKEAAIDRLLADAAAPEAFDVLAAAVARANPGGETRIYPGSPALVAAALRPQDRMVACELRPDDHAALAELLAPLGEQARAVLGDGFAEASKATLKGRNLTLIDPPFERDDDYRRIGDTVRAILPRNDPSVTAIWVPLKDLDTFDRFLTRLEAMEAPMLVGEVRLRPLTDPMKLNGCAMVVVNPPAGAEEALRAICGWVAQHLGEEGNEARVWRL
jgi:23S rRNA (adenine2030-N6)-methyltransferase